MPSKACLPGALHPEGEQPPGTTLSWGRGPTSPPLSHWSNWAPRPTSLHRAASAGPAVEASAQLLLLPLLLSLPLTGPAWAYYV